MTLVVDCEEADIRFCCERIAQNVIMILRFDDLIIGGVDDEDLGVCALEAFLRLITNVFRVGIFFDIVYRMIEEAEWSAEILREDRTHGDESRHRDDVRHIGVDGTDIHRGESAPAVSHDGNGKIFIFLLIFQRGDASVKIGEGLREAIGGFACGFRTTRVVVSENEIAVAREHFDLLHICAVTAAEAVIENYQSVRNGTFVAVNISFKRMSEG